MSSNHQADSVLQSERCNGTKKLEFQQFTDRRVSSNPSLAQEMDTAKPHSRVCNSSSGHKWNINVKLRHRIAIYHFGVFYLQLKHHHADTWTPFVGALLLTRRTQVAWCRRCIAGAFRCRRKILRSFSWWTAPCPDRSFVMEILN